MKESPQQVITNTVLEAFNRIRPGGSLEETLMDMVFHFGLCDGCDRSRHLYKKTRLCMECQGKKDNPDYHFGRCSQCAPKQLYPMNQRLIVVNGICFQCDWENKNLKDRSAKLR